ncbi:Programmed cell death protein 4, variant 2 [Bonamia ostreae]|uniref:Programmed cell death protein 4, variant 2 n=1 Tax=Bonamia ostreae TaxID=126728 RepID=A0ABV2AJ29_9EUKA
MSRSVRRGSVSPGSKELFAMKMKGLQDFKVRVSRIVKDYLIANDYEDFVSRINELEPKKSEIEQIPKILMSISFDRNDNERKVVSDLIVKLVMNKVIKEKDLGMGFSLLLSQVPDLRLDVPNVVQYLEYFVDSFVNNKVLKYGDSSKFVEVLSIYSGSNPRKTIKKIVEKIIKNYFVSGELEECQRAIEEINDTNLYPLVVKYVVSLSFDFGASQRELVSQLFAKVVDDHVETKFIQQKHLGEGFILLLNNAEDLSKDVPEVFDYLSFFIARAISDESLPRSFVKNSAEKTTNDALIVATFTIQGTRKRRPAHPHGKQHGETALRLGNQHRRSGRDQVGR